MFLYQAEEVGTAKAIVKGKKEAVHGIVHGLKVWVLARGFPERRSLSEVVQGRVFSLRLQGRMANRMPVFKRLKSLIFIG